MGSCAALWLLDAEGVWVLPVVLIAGMLVGGVGCYPCCSKKLLNTNEILSTIMLNYISLNILLYGIHGPLKDPHGFNFPGQHYFLIGKSCQYSREHDHLGVLLHL